MNISLNLNTSLKLTLTPQLVQYLKLLQLTSLQLEQHLQHELEINPMLELNPDTDLRQDDANSPDAIGEDFDVLRDDADNREQSEERGISEMEAPVYDNTDATNPDDNSWQDYIENDERPPSRYDDDDFEPMPIKANRSFVEELIDQLHLLNLGEEERMLGEEILWNIEPSGYLARELEDIVEECNDLLRNQNVQRVSQARQAEREEREAHADLHTGNGHHSTADAGTEYRTEIESFPDLAGRLGVRLYRSLSIEDAEKVLKIIQRLEPPGIGARNLRECLLVQLDALPKLNAAQKLAREVLDKTFEAFKMKHFDVMLRELRVSEEYLREALEVIRSLNPKPGGGEMSVATHTIVPDFFVVWDEEQQDFLVYLNDSRLPAIRINEEYNAMRKAARRKKFNPDTRKWLRQKFDDAKFLMQALQLRRQTMRKVITALVQRQRDFFLKGENALKPLIQKDVAEDTGLDISTISRVVNGKYVQTEFGLFELRYFFSESLSTDEGEEVSTKVIKNKLRAMIEGESKKKPLSDQKLADELNKEGFSVARRTVAKYREQMNIPVARLRKEL